MVSSLTFTTLRANSTDNNFIKKKKKKKKVRKHGLTFHSLREMLTLFYGINQKKKFKVIIISVII